MNCSHVIDALQEFLDRGPIDRLPTHVEEHLAGCAQCRQLWEQLRAVESGLNGLAHREADEPSANLHESIMVALAQETVQPRQHLRVPARLALAASIMLGLTAIYWLAAKAPFQQRQEKVAVRLSLPSLPFNETNLDPLAIIKDSSQDLTEMAGSFGATVSGLIVSIKRANETVSPRGTQSLSSPQTIPL